MLEDCWAKPCDCEDSKREEEDIGGWASCDSDRRGSGRDSTANPEKDDNVRLIEKDINIKIEFLNIVRIYKAKVNHTHTLICSRLG